MIEILDSTLTFLFTNDWAHLIAFSIIIPIIVLIYTTRQSNRKNEELRKENKELSEQVRNATKENNDLKRKIQEASEKKRSQHSETLEVKNVMKEHIEQWGFGRNLKNMQNLTNPKTVREFFLKALTLESANLEERSIKNYEKVIELEPNSEMACIAYYNIGCIYKNTEESSLAIEYFEKTIEFAFEYLGLKAKAYCNIGTIYYEKQDYDKAMKYYETYITFIDKKNKTNDPNDRYAIQRAYHNVGMTYYKKHDYGNAIKYYENIGKLDEEDDIDQEAYMNLIFIYYHNKQDYDKVIEYCERIIELDWSMDDEAYHCMGNVWYHKQELEKAIKCYEKAILINKNKAQTYYNIGIVYLKKQEQAKATKYYEKAVKFDCYTNNQDWNNAILNNEIFSMEDIHEMKYDHCSIDIDDIKDIYDSTGQKCMQKHEYDKAIEYYENVIDLEPQNVIDLEPDDKAYSRLGKTYHNLSKAYEAKGDIDKSLECKNKAKELGFEEK